MAEAFRVRCYWDGLEELFPKSHFPVMVPHVSTTMAWSCKPSLIVPSACARCGTWHWSRLRSASSSVPQICSCRSGKARHSITVLCHVTLYTTPQQRKVSNFSFKAQSQEKLKLPESLELSTNIAHYFAQVQYLGLGNTGHLLGASQHTYIVIRFCNIKYWLLFIHTSPRYLSSSSY